MPIGALHPITQLLDRAIQIFRRMGFALADGPDIETEWHCFDALNTPADHPARNEQDTFYLPDGRLLRTHTSTVQIRTMEAQPPPVRIIAPGAAYRRDEVDATHLAQFNQMEGLYVDEGVTVADLKGTMRVFLPRIVRPGREVPLPSALFPVHGTELRDRHQSRRRSAAAKWLELAGCGMVDPAVFEAINARRGDDVYDPEKIHGLRVRLRPGPARDDPVRGFGHPACSSKTTCGFWGSSNDEARMTNDERMTKSEARGRTRALRAGTAFGHSSFGFHSSFVIRHSSFPHS